MNRTIIIGDVHGCSQTLEALLYQEIRIEKSDYIICLGDYIDRGHNSKEVIDILLDLRAKGYNIDCLRGNHEQMLINTYYHPELSPQWLRNGGNRTLKSFGIDDIRKLPEKYLQFFNSTKFIVELENFYIVHAGMNFELADPLVDTLSMLWTRNISIDRNKIKNKRLIVGHTPKQLPEIEKSLQEDTIFLDGGCVYEDMEEGRGYLVALHLEEMKLFYRKNIEINI